MSRTVALVGVGLLLVACGGRRDASAPAPPPAQPTRVVAPSEAAPPPPAEPRVTRRASPAMRPPTPVTPVAPTPPADPSDHGRFVRLHPHPVDGRIVDILAAAKRRADAAGLKLFVELGAPWCKPCAAIERYVDDPRMVEAFAGTLVVKLDIDDRWDRQLEEAGYTAPGIPRWFEVGPDLRPTGRTLTSSAWGEDIPDNMAGPLARFFAVAEK